MMINSQLLSSDKLSQIHQHFLISIPAVIGEFGRAHCLVYTRVSRTFINWNKKFHFNLKYSLEMIDSVRLWRSGRPDFIARDVDYKHMSFQC